MKILLFLVIGLLWNSAWATPCQEAFSDLQPDKNLEGYETLLSTVTNNIRKHRESRGITHAEMIDHGFQRSHYIKLESGKHGGMKIGTLYKLSEAFDTDITSFFKPDSQPDVSDRQTNRYQSYEALLRTVGNNIRKHRESRNITHRGMADHGFQRSHYSHFENGKTRDMNIWTLYKLSVAFDTDITSFFKPDSKLKGEDLQEADLAYDTFLRTVANNIRKHRESRGISIEENRFFRLLESRRHGGMRIETLYKLSEAFDTDITSFFKPDSQPDVSDRQTNRYQSYEALSRTVGNNIRKHRESRGILSWKVRGFTHDSYHSIENGKKGITIRTLYKLSVVFDTDITSFFEVVE